MIRLLQRITFTALVLALSGSLVHPAGARQSQARPQTWQETQNFKAGPTPFEPLMNFWYELDAMSDLVSIRPLTKTLLDREFTLVTIAKDTPEQRTQMETRAAAMMKQRQRVPMMRVVEEQPKALLEVTRYTDLNRTRYAQPW
jgi:hypothetical protein